jgi:predicted lipid-binding transport protein (Tim44 family)
MSTLRGNAPTLTRAAYLNAPSKAMLVGIGVGKSFGSRGSRTYTVPPASKTALKAAPIEQSMADKRSPPIVYNAQFTAAAARFNLFGRWQGLLVGGLLAASLGSVFGLGDVANGLSFLLLSAIVGGGIYLMLNFSNARAGSPAPRAGSSDKLARPNQPNRSAFHFHNRGVTFVEALTVRKDDLDSFERLLGEIQVAYSYHDTDALGARATPEMFSHFSQELYDNAIRGLRNEVSDIKLLQADVSEAWSENGSDYATIAMRYSMISAIVQSATGKVVSGDRNRPSEAIELWTFRRDRHTRTDGWELSAIQQGT